MSNETDGFNVRKIVDWALDYHKVGEPSIPRKSIEKQVRRVLKTRREGEADPYLVSDAQEAFDLIRVDLRSYFEKLRDGSEAAKELAERREEARKILEMQRSFLVNELGQRDASSDDRQTNGYIPPGFGITEPEFDRILLRAIFRETVLRPGEGSNAVVERIFDEESFRVDYERHGVLTHAMADGMIDSPSSVEDVDAVVELEELARKIEPARKEGNLDPYMVSTREAR